MKAPTNGRITLGFNATEPPYSPSAPHAGVDYAANQGDPVVAPHAGKITVAGDMGPCGNGIDIDGGRFKSRLCHNSQLLLGVGTQVSEGQLVARAGSTGLASGPHSHWVLWDNGTRVDGSKYVGENEDMGKTAEGDINSLYLEFLGRPAYDFGNKKWIDEGAKIRVGRDFAEQYYAIKDSPEAKAYKESKDKGYDLVSEPLYRRK